MVQNVLLNGDSIFITIFLFCSFVFFCAVVWSLISVTVFIIIIIIIIII